MVHAIVLFARPAGGKNHKPMFRWFDIEKSCRKIISICTGARLTFCYASKAGSSPNCSARHVWRHSHPSLFAISISLPELRFGQLVWWYATKISWVNSATIVCNFRVGVLLRNGQYSCQSHRYWASSYKEPCCWKFLTITLASSLLIISWGHDTNWIANKQGFDSWHGFQKVVS